MNILVCNNLSKNFGKFAAINDVNFTVQAKDLLAVIGPNGAGKSTLFNLISGRYAPSAGDIYFKGEKDNNVLLRIKNGINGVLRNLPKF